MATVMPLDKVLKKQVVDGSGNTHSSDPTYQRCVGAIQQQQNACGTLHVAHPPDGGSPVQISSVRLYYRVETDTVEIEVQTDAGQPPISIELFSLKGSDCPFPKLPSNRKRTPGDTGCDQTFDQIQAWLTECCIGIEDASTERQEIQESDIGAKKHKYTAFLSNFVTNNASTDSQQHNNSIMWQSMVRDFSELKLTIPTDRLPALDGLRSRFGDLKDAKYFHGLWQDTIHSDMLWFQSDSRSAHISINVPTWSWARVGGMVNFFEYDYTTRGNWDRKKIERLFGCLDDKVPDGQLRLTWRTPYDLIPAHLEYVQPQNRRQSTDIGTGVLSSSRECDSVSPTREIQTGTNVQDASSVDGPLDNNPTSSDQASSYTLPSGPSSIRSEDDDASIDNPGFHNSSTYLSFFVKHVYTGYVHENTMALNYVSNFFEDWNMRESRDKLAPGSVVSCLLLAEASSNTWLFIVLHDLSNGTFRRIGALEVYTIDDPSLAETGPVQAPFPFEQLNEDKVIVIV
ncbi:hypothetical protein E8E11_009738 [Didymella keratinophila]|nr:hypothetical protein E8E11_009738 [Didymella keratinophila]